MSYKIRVWSDDEVSDPSRLLQSFGAHLVLQGVLLATVYNNEIVLGR